MRRPLVLGLSTGLLLAIAAPGCAQVATQRATTEPVDRSQPGWARRHQQILERTHQGKPDLLLIGDSITQGWEGSGAPVWERYYAPRHAANLGIGGDRTQHVLWRLDHGEVDDLHPKVAVVMIGTNNLSSDSAEDIAAGITAIVQKLRDKLPETKVLLLGIFPRGAKPDNPARAKIKAINAKVAGLDDGSHVKYLDIGDRFLEEDGTILPTIMPDFLHLSRKGYRIWADAIEPTLWSMMESGAQGHSE